MNNIGGMQYGKEYCNLKLLKQHIASEKMLCIYLLTLFAQCQNCIFHRCV